MLRSKTPVAPQLQKCIHTQYGGGDVAILVSNTAPNCGAGFWLSPDDPGFSAALSLLLSAYHAGSNIHMAGEDSDTWSGSSQAYCRLVTVGLN